MSHQNQNELIFRYVFQISEKKSFEVCERFIEFTNFTGITEEAITNEILYRLKHLKITLTCSRAQGYDIG